MIHSHVYHLFRTPCVALLAALAVMLIPATPVNAQDVDKRANTVGVEILGRALLYSANYERSFNRIGAGAGVAVWSFGSDTAVIVPIYASFRPVGSVNSLYLAGGATVGGESRTFFDRPVTAGTLSVGFEHRSSSGLVIRPTATYGFTRDGGIVWPGVLVGFRF
ncbi:MAG TPA: hypothetical protein VFY29_06125 [Terriglobia bacterium]|nr:hypothetical protein [Terriglobia bacterium]